jgi:alkylation response protein AidB-like acyl-CoA dehydrogenase
MRHEGAALDQFERLEEIMTMNKEATAPVSMHQNVVTIAHSLGPSFAARAAEADNKDTFVAANYSSLKQSGLVEAGVPKDFGGGGAEIAELCGMIREIAHYCGSTALAFAMHTHQVAIPAWRFANQNAAAVMPLLKRVASERIILLSSGGSDWLEGSGKAERVDGGYKITATKIFTSGSFAGDLLMTGAVLNDATEGRMVLHFGVPMSSPHVSVRESWQAMGMRGTASNDVIIDGHFVPEEAVAVRRKQGEWHPLFHIISMIAFPLIYAAYLGVAESACRIVIDLAKTRDTDSGTVRTIGLMQTELRAGQYAHAAMVAAAKRGNPSPETTNEMMMGRFLVARHAIAAVELAMEAAGGTAFMRRTGLERRFRDIQGARYHPMRSGPQQEFTGRMALGMDTLHTF